MVASAMIMKEMQNDYNDVFSGLGDSKIHFLGRLEKV